MENRYRFYSVIRGEQSELIHRPLTPWTITRDLKEAKNYFREIYGILGVEYIDDFSSEEEVKASSWINSTGFGETRYYVIKEERVDSRKIPIDYKYALSKMMITLEMKDKEGVLNSMSELIDLIGRDYLEEDEEDTRDL